MEQKKNNSILKILLCIISLCFTSNALAYTPSLESLLRNGSNPDVNNNTVTANLEIKEINPESNSILMSEEAIAQNQAIKLIISNENEELPILTQVNYKGVAISNSSLINISQNSFTALGRIVPLKENIDARIFYALMGTLLNNQGGLLIEALKVAEPGIVRNVSLVNNEKFNLLKKYRDYLIATNTESEEELSNPFKPSTIEEKERVKLLRESTFLVKDNLVKRVKIEDDFFWVVEKDSINIKFDSNHRLKELSIKTEKGTVEVVFGRFINHRAQQAFPEFIWFKDTTGRKYQIKALRLSMAADSKEAMQRRIKRYKKYSEENELIENEEKPNFIL